MSGEKFFYPRAETLLYIFMRFFFRSLRDRFSHITYAPLGMKANETNGMNGKLFTALYNPRDICVARFAVSLVNDNACICRAIRIVQ